MSGRLLAYKGAKPQLTEPVFVADGARIIGRVTIGSGSGVWFNCVLRADDNDIKIGADTNIQDGTIIHCEPDYPTIIGDRVTVGHNAIIHGCTVGHNCLIGMGAVVLTGATIGDNCIIGAGSLITAGKTVPAGSLVVGSPGRVIRQLTDEERENIRWSARHYRIKASEYSDVVEE
jgi:carbonic anhydrase/acetyltransferase-like protein (isoleucine patch superfamily)